MSKESISFLQPALYERFTRVLQAGRLGHAYLFSGDMGSMEMALFLSQSVVCTEKREGLACGACRTCRLIAEGQFADVTVIEPQGQVIKTDTVREVVKQFSRSAFEGACQFVIIRDADKMHVNAANSLLKVIEEPQAAIHLFLLTNQEDKILPTIKSRVQLVTFPKNRIVLQDIMEREGLPKPQAALLSHLVADQEEAKKWATSKPLLEQIQGCRTFAALLLEGSPRASLQSASLLALAGEKTEQARLFDLLGLIVAEQIHLPRARTILTQLAQVKIMWQANVSFQNCLDYLVLQVKKTAPPS